MIFIYREEAAQFADAHAEGWHTPPDGVPREGCPECEGRDLSSYPRAPGGTAGVAADPGRQWGDPV